MFSSSRSVFLGAVASVAAGASLAGAAVAADLIKLRAAALPIVDAAPLFVAIDQGYFAAEGLDVSVAPEYTGTVGLSGAVAGAYDIVYTNTPSTLVAIQQGIDLRFIGLASPIGPPDVTALMTRKGENFKTPKDFAGKSIGINGIKNLQWMIIRGWLKAGGVDPDQVTLRDVPFPQMLDALKNKQVDGIFAIEPFLSIDLQDPTIEVAGHPFDVLPRVRAAGWVATGAYVQQHPDLVKKFVTALNKGAQWVNANRSKEAFFKLVAGYTKLDPARVAQMRITQAMTDVDANDLRRVAALMRDTGLLTSTADPATKIYIAK
jgi:NitT/TauT family transport system substrate-binding protein